MSFTDKEFLDIQIQSMNVYRRTAEVCIELIDAGDLVSATALLREMQTSCEDTTLEMEKVRAAL